MMETMLDSHMVAVESTNIKNIHSIVALFMERTANSAYNGESIMMVKVRSKRDQYIVLNVVDVDLHPMSHLVGGMIK